MECDVTVMYWVWRLLDWTGSRAGLGTDLVWSVAFLNLPNRHLGP